MYISGGKVLAIGKVHADETSLSGDGVFVPLGVKDYIGKTAIENELSGKVDVLPSTAEADTQYVAVLKDGKTQWEKNAGAGSTVSAKDGVSAYKEDGTTWVVMETSARSVVSSVPALMENVETLSTDLEGVKTDLGNLSGNFTAHSANGASHVNDDERAKWNTVTNKAELTALETVSSNLGTLTNDFNSHSADTVVHITSAERNLWNGVSSKAEASALNDYYKKTETSGADQISTALSALDKAKQDVLTFQYDNEFRISAINTSAIGGVVLSAGSGIDAAQFAKRIIQLDKEYQPKGDYQPAGDYVSATTFANVTKTLTSAISDVGDHVDDVAKLLDEQKADVSALTSFEAQYSAYISSVSGAINSGAAASAWVASSADKLALKADLDNYLLNSAFSSYVSSNSGAIASGAAASAWLAASAEYLATSSMLPDVSGGDNIDVSAVKVNDHYRYIVSGHAPVELYSRNDSIKIGPYSAYDPTKTDPQQIDIEVNLPEADYGTFHSESTELTKEIWNAVDLICDASSESITTITDLHSNMLYHVDVNLKFTRTSNLSAVYETIQMRDSGVEGKSRTFEIGMLDASTSQPQFVNVSYDIRLAAALTYSFKPESTGWTVEVVRYDIHDVNGGMSPGSTESMAETVAETSEKVTAITTTVDNRIIVNMNFSEIDGIYDAPNVANNWAMQGTIFTPVMTVEITERAVAGIFAEKLGGSGKGYIVILEWVPGNKTYHWVCNTDLIPTTSTGYIEIPITNRRAECTLYSDKLYYACFMTKGVSNADWQIAGKEGYVAAINATPRLVMNHNIDGNTTVNADTIGTLLATFEPGTGGATGSGLPKLFVALRNKGLEEA